MKKFNEMIISDGFEEFCDIVEDMKENYENREDILENIDTVDDLLSQVPIPYLVNFSTQSIEEWMAKYRVWYDKIKNMRNN